MIGELGFQRMLEGIGRKSQVTTAIQLEKVRSELTRFDMNLAQGKSLKIGFKGSLTHRECCVPFMLTTGYLISANPNTLSEIWCRKA
ncbi:hypothetical protein CTI12_AA152160 [Artemisia annua]|uniref:Uncharacterized protein n=1 Tax=Artemisia annua TaxID=35608 RepID=A0A2U1PH16_ARTAN|nr:hypothetical protein CTI12_AA152160 [Artemisia annua]